MAMSWCQKAGHDVLPDIKCLAGWVHEEQVLLTRNWSLSHLPAWQYNLSITSLTHSNNIIFSTTDGLLIKFTKHNWTVNIPVTAQYVVIFCWVLPKVHNIYIPILHCIIYTSLIQRKIPLISSFNVSSCDIPLSSVYSIAHVHPRMQ